MINMGVVPVDISVKGLDVVAFDVFKFGYLFIVVGDKSLDTFASTATASVAMKDAGHVGGEEVDDTVMGL